MSILSGEIVVLIAKYQWIAYYVLFPVYVLFDWSRTQKINRVNEFEGVVTGFKRTTLAWGLKMFVAYWLIYAAISFTQATLGCIHYTQSVNAPETYLEIHSKMVETDIKPVNPSETTMPIQVMLHSGTIDTRSRSIFWLNIIYWITKAGIGIGFLVLVWMIVHPISLRKPFTPINVNRLRGLGILVLAFKGVEWIYILLCDWIVKNQYQFPSTDPNLRMQYFDYPIVIILCLAIFIMAEIIQSGAELKNDQDLTV